MSEVEYLSVSTLNEYLNQKMTRDPYLQEVYLTGEIANFRPRAKHQYFSLKDEAAVINACMWQSNFSKLKFALTDGMKVLVKGHLDFYRPHGSCSFIVDELRLDGIGELHQALGQLKEKLFQEGLVTRPKKPLPKYPHRIAVITSPSGAVIRDIITTVRRRYPIAQIVLFPALVQGTAATDSLVARLKQVNELGNFDVVIIGRGGGSLEDLWPFNEEKVARAIAQSKIPVISSVGHETDTTISDLVADQRAATPTAAAELAVPVLNDELRNVFHLKKRLQQATRRLLNQRTERFLRSKNAYIFQQPGRIYESYQRNLINLNDQLFKSYQRQVTNQVTQVNNLQQRLMTRTKHLTQTKQHELFKQMQALDLLSPLKTLSKGYSYVETNGQAVKSVTSLTPDANVRLHFHDGTAAAKIIETKQNERTGEH